MHEIEFHEIEDWLQDRDVRRTTIMIYIREIGRMKIDGQHLYGSCEITGPAFHAGRECRDGFYKEREEVLDDLIKLYLIYYNAGYMDNFTHDIEWKANDLQSA